MQVFLVAKNCRKKYSSWVWLTGAGFFPATESTVPYSRVVFWGQGEKEQEESWAEKTKTAWSDCGNVIETNSLWPVASFRGSYDELLPLEIAAVPSFNKTHSFSVFQQEKTTTTWCVQGQKKSWSCWISTYCWWKESGESPVEVGSWNPENGLITCTGPRNPMIYEVFYIPGGCWGFLPSTVVHPMLFGAMCNMS